MSEPPEPNEDPYRPRPLLGPAFWALMAFAGLCVAAGVAVAVLGPRLAPAAG